FSTSSKHLIAAFFVNGFPTAIRAMVSAKAKKAKVMPSVITPKAANGYHFKTGHRTSVRDKSLYSFISRTGKRLLAFLISVSNDCPRRTWWEVWKAFCAFQAVCGNHEKKAAAGHRIRFPQLRHFPQVIRLFWRSLYFGAGVGKNVAPGSSIDDDR